MNKQSTYAALLRGINVGGNSIISMAELRACFEALGYGGVRTYINSGNVIFSADTTSTRALENNIEKALFARFDIPIKTVVRSMADMQAIIAHIPASWHSATDQKCNIILLRRTIDKPDILNTLVPKPGVEELHYFPGVLFWSAKTSDLTKSNMIKLLRLGIYKEMTVRSLNTVHAIYAMMQAL